MNRFLFLTGMFFAVAAQVPGQQKQDEVVVANLAADPEPARGLFTLFSLRTAKTVALADSATDLWDIGFKGTTLIVNGGSRRAGKGGVYLVEGDYGTFTGAVDEQLFAGDKSDSETAVKGGSGNGWYVYDFSTHQILPAPGRFLMIRTANGQYAKLKISDYYQTAPVAGVPRYYSFSYVLLQPAEKAF